MALTNDNAFMMTPTSSRDHLGSSESYVQDFQDVAGQVRVILQQEASHYGACVNYLKLSGTPKSSQHSDHVSESWRRKICEWSFEVVDHFGFDREVVSIALNYLDRVVAHKTTVSGCPLLRREFQLIAVTSLYLAIKLHGETDVMEGPRRKLKIQAFVELSRGLFQVETLEKMELEILTALKWHVNPPTTVRILATFLRLLPKYSSYGAVPPNGANMIFEMSKYLTELSVCVSEFTFRFNPSVIAYSAIICAIDALHESLVLPLEVKITFLNHLAEVTNLTPADPLVREARSMLMDLCPSMFDRLNPPDMIPSGIISCSSAPSEGGKTSPICVCDPIPDDNELITRKRGRSPSESC